METLLGNADKRSDPPRIYAFVENPHKNTNLGPFLRCASAFGIDLVVAIGYDKCSVEGLFCGLLCVSALHTLTTRFAGSHGAAKHVQIVAFPTHVQAAAFLRDDLGCSVIFGLLGPLPGGEAPCSLLVTTDTQLVTFSGADRAGDARFTSFPLTMLQIPSAGNIGVAFSKHRQELPLPMAELCDVLLHVPHRSDPERLYSRPLLDDVACFSILLHQLRQTSGYSVHSFEGHKYDVTLDARQRQQEDLAGQRRAERAQRDNETQQAWNDANRDGLGLWRNELGDY
jgi:hypothetical protein